MAWLISRALMESHRNYLYSQGLEHHLPPIYLDGEQSAALNVMPTQHKFWRNDKTMEFSNLSLFGLTLRLLTEEHGEDLLTWYREVFLARTSALQERVRESLDLEADCGLKCTVSFAKLSQCGSMWKTAQHSLFEDLELSLETFPRLGTMRNGELFHAEMSVEFTYESAPGLTLPTTGANEGKGAGKDRYLSSPAFRGAKMSEGLRICETDPIYLNPLFAELVMMWPLGWTDLKPLAMDKFQEWQQQHGICLEVA